MHGGVLLEMKSSRVSTGIASQHFWLKCGIQMLFSLFFGFFLPLFYTLVEGVGAGHTLNSSSDVFKVENNVTNWERKREVERKSIKAVIHCKKLHGKK